MVDISEHRMRDTARDPRSVPELLGDLMRDLTTLVRKESQLVRAELSEKVTQVKTGLGEMAAGAICMLAALLVLLQALVIGLSKWIGPGWASLLVGIAVAALGFFLLRQGAKNMSPDELTPERTARQVSKDAEMVKEQAR